MHDSVPHTCVVPADFCLFVGDIFASAGGGLLLDGNPDPLTLGFSCDMLPIMGTRSVQSVPFVVSTVLCLYVSTVEKANVDSR